MLLQEHLLVILGEECNEVAHRVSKALRFGLREVQEGQPLTNAERIIEEYSQLQAVMQMLFDQALIPATINTEAYHEKFKAVNKFLEYSKTCGTLTE